VKQASAPATDGFLAKFSTAAGAPAQPDAYDSQQDSAHCWENRLAVDPTKPFHYRVSTRCSSVCRDTSPRRVTLKYTPSSVPHTVSHKATYPSARVCAHMTYVDVLRTSLCSNAHTASSGLAAGTPVSYFVCSNAHTASSGLVAGTPVSYFGGNGFKFRFARWQT
jgi:hypothetical protein